MKNLIKYGIMCFVAILIYSCSNTTDYEYQNKMLFGTSYYGADTSIINNIGTTFYSTSGLYVKVSTKEAIKDNAIALKIQLETGTDVTVLFFKKRWMDEPYHSSVFFVEPSILKAGNYKAYLMKDGDTNPLSSCDLVIK